MRLVTTIYGNTDINSAEGYFGEGAVKQYLDKLTQIATKVRSEIRIITPGDMLGMEALLTEWERERCETGINALILLPPTQMGIDRANYLAGLPVTQVRLLQSGEERSWHVHLVGSMYTGICTSTNKEPHAFLMESMQLAEEKTGYFNRLWERSQQVKVK